jgi:8-oxo-dGTP diphosphatase
VIWVDAGARTVAGLLRDSTVLAEVLRVAGHRLVRAPGRWLATGDTVAVGLRLLPGVRVRAAARVRTIGLDGAVVELRCGVLPARAVALRFLPAGTGTAVRVEPTGWFPRRLRAGLRAALAEGLVAGAAAVEERAVVVATALVRDGAVLAAQRTRPPALAGRWELPGGRVEAGETEADAVVRECREELDCAVAPAGRVGTDLLIDAGVLRVHAAAPAGGAEPRAVEHAALRWVGPDELDDLDWVDADRAVLPDLRELLAARPAPA